MKKIIFTLAWLTIFFAGNAQQWLPPARQAIGDAAPGNPYLQKSKNQKLAGTLLAAGGLAMLTIGMVKVLSDFAEIFSLSGSSPGDRTSTGGEGFCVAGGVALAGSLPFLLASRRNGRKARLLTENHTTNITPSFRIRQTAVCVAFPIGR